MKSVGGLTWQSLVPDEKNNWLSVRSREEFETHSNIASIFSLNSNGLKTNRDTWAYNYDAQALSTNIASTIETYNQEVTRWVNRRDKKTRLDEFLTTDQRKISWSETLKAHVEAGDYASFDQAKIRLALYRPFSSQFVYFDELLNERQYQLRSVFPTGKRGENAVLWCKVGSDWPFFSLATDRVPDVLPQGGSRCFPFYAYSAGGERSENIGDGALDLFRLNYGHEGITKWDVFHYLYAVLNHPEYRERYAEILRRELPHIPFVGSSTGSPEGDTDLEAFRSLVVTGKRLAEIHVHYEDQPEYPLKKIEKPGEKLDYHVEKMRLTKDKTSLVYNGFLTLSGIPLEAYEYRLGNRSALEWVIDQYQVSTDKRSGIVNDPNRDDDPEYILRLIGQVITVSLETVKLVRSLPPLGLP